VLALLIFGFSFNLFGFNLPTTSNKCYAGIFQGCRGIGVRPPLCGKRIPFLGSRLIRNNLLPQQNQCRKQAAKDLTHTIRQIDQLPLHLNIKRDYLYFSTDFERLLQILADSPSFQLPQLDTKAEGSLFTQLPGVISSATLNGNHVSIRFREEVRLPLNLPDSKLPVKAEFLVFGEEGKPLEFDVEVDPNNPKIAKFKNITGAKILLEKGKHTFPHELRLDDTGEKFKIVITVDNPLTRPRGLAGIAWPKVVPVHLHLKQEELDMVQKALPGMIHIYSVVTSALHSGDLKQLMALMPDMRLKHKLQVLGVYRRHRSTIHIGL
jgi:hypothetical protein